VVSLLICASELAGAGGKINVGLLCTGLDLSPGFSDFSKVGRRKMDILNDNISGICEGATLPHN